MASFRKRGDKWQAQVRLKGKPPLTATFRTKAQAQEWAREQEDHLKTGSWRNLKTAERTSVSDLLDQYERDITPRKKSENKEKSRLKILRAELGQHAVASLSPQHILAFVDHRRKSCVADTIRKELNTLSHALKTAGALWGIHVAVNPVLVARDVLTATKTLEPGVKRDRRITDAEIDAICKASESAILPTVIRLALETGLRRGEIAAIQPADIIGARLTIPDAKTGKGQVIPLSSAAQELLKAAPFSTTPNAITKAFDRAAKRAGIKGIRFHDLRHEATSRLFEKGLTIEEVAIITRHADWSTLKRYTHLSPEYVARKLG